MARDMLTLAVPKGRLGDATIARLQASGLARDVDGTSRKLVFEDNEAGIVYLFVKPSDVITYVTNGVADLGIIGKDALVEADPDVYELSDLGFGKCVFAVAGLERHHDLSDGTIRVATKYPVAATRHFTSKNRTIDIIKLNGSVELAPLAGLADVIVDIVETGNTLKANGLSVFETFMDISARLICNPSSYAFHRTRILDLEGRLRQREENDT